MRNMEAWQCEQHPGVEWPHGDCPGPGMLLAESPERAPWLSGDLSPAKPSPLPTPSKDENAA